MLDVHTRDEVHFSDHYLDLMQEFDVPLFLLVHSVVLLPQRVFSQRQPVHQFHRRRLQRLMMAVGALVESELRLQSLHLYFSAHELIG